MPNGTALRPTMTFVMTLFLTGSALGRQANQEPAAPASQPAQTPTETKPDVSTKDTAATFKLRVNLVQVKVVVRDAKGNLVENLKREDFELYDQGKLQAITTFGVENAESRRKRAEAAAKTQTEGEEAASGAAKPGLPQRFVALMFDDIHLKMEDVSFVRVSTKKLIDSLAPTDRMGIYSTSGQVTQEFTSDKEALEKKLLSLAPRPKIGKANVLPMNCPEVTYYMGDLSINKGDTEVLALVALEIAQCAPGGNPQQMARMALQQELKAGDTDNEFTYRALEDVMRRIAGMPGERVMVLVSPGFLLSSLTLEEMGIIDRANRAGMVINTVDARGLYTPNLGGSIENARPDIPDTAAQMDVYRLEEQSLDADVLADFANGTGGTFFHNSNDLETGLKQAGASPEVSYILGFSPQNQKLDGRYHAIKVVIADKRKFNIQARRGYYAPKKLDSPEEQAKQEIADAVFSQDEIQDLPLDFQTQYFKSGDASGRLSVVSHIDVKALHFRKAEGRNFDNLTVATAIFDDNGNFVNGVEKLLELRLLDTSYERMARSGLTMKSTFDLKPGNYLVRQVVRDSEGAQMAARNGTVVIP
jgi:VWFA-related protein